MAYTDSFMLMIFTLLFISNFSMYFNVYDCDNKKMTYMYTKRICNYAELSQM